MKIINRTFGILIATLLFISNQAFSQESFKFHKVQTGETAYSISKLYGISLEDFYKFNPEARQSLKSGDVVMIPASTSPTDETIDSTRFLIHNVQEGQTLYSISRQYNVPVDLIEVNNPDIKNQIIRPGMRLLIPKNPKRSPVQSEQQLPGTSAPEDFHLVKPGESLFSIARLYDITVSDIFTFNPQLDSVIYPGQLIRVHLSKNEGKTSHPAENTSGISKDTTRYTMHRVEDGETLYSIARKYNQKIENIQRYNPELRQMSIKSGMLLLIPLSMAVDEDSEVYEPKPEVPDFADEKAVGFVSYFNLLGKRNLKISLILPISSDLTNRDLRPVDIVAMDYYLGVKTALETLQKDGYQFTLQIVELPENSTDFYHTFSKIKYSDFIIGPFVPLQTKSFLESFPDKGKVPVIIPFGTVNNSAAGTVWIQESEDHELRELASSILSEYTELPIYLIYTNNKDNKANKLNDQFRSYLGKRNIREIHLTGGLQGLSAVTDLPEPKIIVFFHDENFLSQQFIERMRRQRNNNILVLHRKILDNPLIEPRYLNQLNVLIASPRHIQHEHSLVIAASESIANQYKLETNDIMLYAFQSVYDLVRSLTDPGYVTKFIKINPTLKKGVFQNEAVQVLTVRNYKLVPLQSAGTQNQ